ncbi:MAG: aromatic ring-hydroxylating dioxygenase subunit alpha [Bacteroidetes bacterium]|nr:aromatic ring-hydroxylating dioxygenase subunit alpha [Bacteroidota bacterium]
MRDTRSIRELIACHKSGWSLEQRFYTDPEIYALEIESIVMRNWIFAGHQSQLAEVGDYLVLNVASESAIVVRSKQGGIKAFANVCRHRGSIVCLGKSGNQRTFECPYHGWMYDTDGNLIAARNMPEDFDRTSFGLHKLPVEIIQGLIFVCFCDAPPSIEGARRDMAEPLAMFDFENLKVAAQKTYPISANWKLAVENYQECYHCPGVHPLLSQWTPFRSAVHDCFDGAVIGGYMEMSEPGGSMTMDGKAAAPPVCNVSGDDLQRVHYYSVFPNLLLSPHPDFVLYHRIRSVAVGQIRNDCFFLLHPDVIGEPKHMERFQSAIEFWDMTNRQDWAVCEQMQLGLGSRRFERGRYSPQEDILWALDKEVLKALGHTLPE